MELNIIPDELDPLIPYGYNSSDGFLWSDVDSDGIPEFHARAKLATAIPK